MQTKTINSEMKRCGAKLTYRMMPKNQYYTQNSTTMVWQGGWKG
jgi:hypothetical protein